MNEDNSNRDELLRKAREYVKHHEGVNTQKVKGSTSSSTSTTTTKGRSDRKSSSSHKSDSKKRSRKYEDDNRDHRRGDHHKRHKKEKKKSRGNQQQQQQRLHDSDDTIVDEDHERRRRKKHNRHERESKKKKNNRKGKETSSRPRKYDAEHAATATATTTATTSTTRSFHQLKDLLGPIVDKPPVTKITVDDYFSYHNHLRIYLYYNSKHGGSGSKGNSSRTYFEDLSSLQSHEIFELFCKEFNAGTLQQAYYDINLSSSLPHEVLDTCKRTKHQWNFKTNVTERKSLDLIKSGVKKQTEYQDRDATVVVAGATTCTPCTTTTGTNHVQKPRNDTTKVAVRRRPMIPERANNNHIETLTKTSQQSNQEEILKMLGLKGIKAGEKITIAPRK